jgi:hypothetical protein
VGVLRRVPILPSLLRGSGPISRIERSFRGGLRIPEVSLGPTLTLLTLTRSCRLCLRSGALREPPRRSGGGGCCSIKRARLRGRSTAALWASRADTTDVFGTTTLDVRFEGRLGRRVGPSPARAKTLLVLMLVLVSVERLAVVRARQDADTDTAEASAQLM